MPSRPVDEMSHARAVHVKTLGCKVNQAESEAVAAALAESGISIAAAGQSEVVIVNTCSVTAEADRKARKAIRQALLSPSRPTVLVTGCLAALDPDGLSALGGRVVVEPDRERIVSRARSALGLEAVRGTSAVRSANRSRSRVAVKVQDGCDVWCAYCVVPLARGGPRSVGLSTVLREVDVLVASGVAEIVLTGVNLGQYRSSGATLADLVRSVATTGVKRLRLSSIEPLSLTHELVEALAATPQLCPHLHVPLQSGSDAILRAMRRGYSAAGYLARIAAVREAVPGIAVTTDVMAGFPGEAESDFGHTLSVIEEADFARLHVFRYSKRAGTVAARLDCQVGVAEADRRAAILREHDARLRREYARRRRGQEAEVLVERVTRVDSRKALARGTTEDYLKARFVSGKAVKHGDVVRVRLGDVLGEEVLATPLVERRGAAHGRIPG